MNYKTVTMAMLLSQIGLLGCGRDASVADYKLAGVGLNPEEITSPPEKFGGFISYDYIDFAGAALPLGLVGLSSFTGAGPSLGTFAPPYSMVVGSGFIFDKATPSPDALFGSFGSAPEQIGSCHTVFEPKSYLSGVADVGSAVSLRTDDGAGYDIGRRPLTYPSNASKVFPYYMDLETYKEVSKVWRNPSAQDATDLRSWNFENSTEVNFPFGEQVGFSFKGAIPTPSANFSSIPQPYNSAVNGEYHPLPTKPQGLMVSWSGVQYSGDGAVLADDGEHSVCMQFSSSGAIPTSPVDCMNIAEVEAPKEGQFDRGQMYTGPWDTDGGVTIRWIPSDSGIEENVSVSVRFLGSVDETDDSFVDNVVMMKTTNDVQGAWDAAIRNGTIPEGAECPSEGSRPALPCDTDITPQFDPSLKRGDGYVPSLQGNPLKNLVETTCTVNDVAGEFVITNDMLDEAITYAKQHNAKGAVFYFKRTTKTIFDVPDVRDSFGTKKQPGDVMVLSNAVEIGRFWVTDGTF